MYNKESNSEFKKNMKKTHTILLPDMLHYHNELLKAAFKGAGYNFEIVPEVLNSEKYSMRFISGDYCLPAIQILGQLIAAFETGLYNPNKTAFMEPQTGGACRAGNYYNSIINGMKKAGYGQVPIISLNAFGEEKHEGFSITPKLLFRAIAAVCYGDLLMTLYQQACGRQEDDDKRAKQLYDKWTKILSRYIYKGKHILSLPRKKIYRKIVNDFSNIVDKNKSSKKRVGIVGEIYIKFSPIGNNHIEEFLKKQNCDYRMGGFVNYIIYIVDSEKENQKLKGKSILIIKGYDIVLSYLQMMQKTINAAIESTNIFTADASFAQIEELAKTIIAKGCNIGDGWLIAGEVADLIRQGYDKILILHPFGCLVSHVCERGIMNKLHELYPHVSIHTVEYDYDSSKTLTESRIMLGIA